MWKETFLLLVSTFRSTFVLFNFQLTRNNVSLVSILYHFHFWNCFLEPHSVIVSRINTVIKQLEFNIFINIAKSFRSTFEMAIKHTKTGQSIVEWKKRFKRFKMKLSIVVFSSYAQLPRHDNLVVVGEGGLMQGVPTMNANVRMKCKTGNKHFKCFLLVRIKGPNNHEKEMSFNEL